MKRATGASFKNLQAGMEAMVWRLRTVLLTIFISGYMIPALASAAPTISSFSPLSGPPQTVITITGTGFSTTASQNTVTFGSKTSGAAQVTAATATSLTVVAPSAGTTGFIWVSVGGVQVSSPSTYEYPPAISNINPTSGAVGSTVTISGSNLGKAKSATFGGGAVQSFVTLLDQNNVSVVVPSGAVNGPITVTSNSGLVSNSSSTFTVVTPSPTITSISPTSGLVGATVTITGTNFNATAANNSVSFNGTAATVTAATTTSLTTTVPVGATTGAVSVTVNGITATGPTFTVQLPSPTISSLSPASGPRGSAVVINGTNFSPTALNNQVYFTDVSGYVDISATVTAATATSLTVTVPASAYSGSVTVAVTGAASSATSPSPFTVTVPIPTITGFSPQIGPVGTSVTITGTNFSATAANDTVKFNGTAATVTAASTTSLTATVPSGATSGPIAVTVSSSQSGIASQTATSSSSYTVGYPPVTITGFTPTSGPVGTQVTISGTNFGSIQGIGNVQLNGVSIPPTSWSDTSIVVMIPTGVTSGPFTVAAATRQSATSSTSYTITPSPPTVTSISPTSGLVGATVTITGTNFNATAANNSISFNGTAATVTAATTTSLTTTVPAGATTGAVSVTVNGMTATGPTFTVQLPSPTISSLSPASGPRGSAVLINGTNFSPTALNNQVYFTDVSGYVDISATVTAATATSLTVTVPASAYSGSVNVAVTGATSSATSPSPFTVTVPIPTITGFSPQIGPVGTSVTITGTNFSATAANDTVKFNGTAATVTAASTTSLTATVPSGATSGPITVTVSSSLNGIGSQTATSSSNYTVGYPPVTITGFTPTSGPYGTTITVSGTNFGANQGIGNIQLNGVILPPNTWTDSSITFTVPDGVTDGPITVANTNRQSATTSASFTITNPTPSIASFTPINGQPGSTVTINGANFSSNASANLVKFNGATAIVVSASTTSLQVQVPSSATSGKLSVSVNNKVGTSTNDFTVIPAVTIASITPASGPRNTIITIDGANFDPVASNNVVMIGDVLQSIIYASSNKLRVQVVRGTMTNSVVVYRAGPPAVSAIGPTFTITAPPSISWISPVSSPAGTQVAIHGAGFDGSSTSANTVTFNGVTGSVVQATANELDVMVPSQATTGQVVVTNQYGSSKAVPATDVALAFRGATTSASSTFSAAYGADSANDGDISGGMWAHDGGWNDGTVNTFPDWLQVTFPSEQKINDVVVYTLRDDFATGMDPTDSTTFTKYGLTAFDVQILQGSTWMTVASVTGNNLVKRRVVFMPVVATAVRVIANASIDGAYSRIVEVEAHYDPSNFVVGPVPTAQITSFTPNQGGPGTQVTIAGQYFGSDPLGMGRVSFSSGQVTGQPAQVVSWSDTSIVVNVPVGAYDGPISVATPTRNYVTSTANFNYIPPPVTVGSFTPAHGQAALATTTINGSGFSAVPSENRVTFSGGVDANIIQASYNSLLVRVPAGAQTGPVTVAVTIDGVTQTGTSSSNFTVDAEPSLSAQFQAQWPFGTDTIINPTTYQPGVLASAQVVMLNNGSTPWSSAQNFYLKEIDQAGWATGGRVNLPSSATITTGNTATFTFTIQIPTAPGIYYFRWQMAQDNADGTTTRFGDGIGAVVYVGSPPPQNPLCVSATSVPAVGNTTLSWGKPTTGTPPDFYRISVSEDGQAWRTLDAVSGSATSKDITASDTQAHYYAVNSCENTPMACSAYVQAQLNLTGAGCPTQPPPPPPPPIAVTVTPPAAGSNQIGVSWQPGTGGTPATHFVLEVATSLSGPWTIVNAQIPVSSTSTTYLAPDNGTYYFGVAACSDTSCSSDTLSAAVTVSGITPSSCTGLSVNTTSVSFASAGSTAQQVTVSAPSGCSWSITSTADTWLTVSPTSGVGGTGGVLVNLMPNGANTSSSVYSGTLSIGGDGVTATVSVWQAGVGVATVAPNLPPAATTIDDSVTNDPTVGTMAGQASTDGGAAQYHVPIVVPPGRAGMQPELALVYNSRSGNGVMGMGWTISGLSSIHRCPETPEQDGIALGVAYNNSDRLCLDGQRLVVVNGATYGSSGAQYRTEVDSYALVTQIGGDLGSGDSACFLVQQKNGRTLHYGGLIAINSSSITSSTCTNSSVYARVKPSGAPAALSWLVQQVQDPVGNDQTYTYTDNGNGEVLISQIAYTGYAPTPTVGTRTVSFAYQSRTAVSGVSDISSSYLAGGLTMQTQALASITTAVNGTTVRTYQPAYAASTYNQRLQMTSLQECASDGTTTSCHSPTQFTYNDGGLNYPFAQLTNINSTLPATAVASGVLPIADFDGDGTRELSISAWDPAHTISYGFLAQIRADQSLQNVVDLSGTPFVLTNTYSDIDGDGRSKLVYPANGYVSFAAWKGSRGQAAGSVSGVTMPCTDASCPGNNFSKLFQVFTSNVPLQSDDQYYVADMNADGKPDIVVVSTHLSGCSSGSSGVYVYLNNMTTTLANAGMASFTAAQGPLFCLTGSQSGVVQRIDHITDFDGDGLPDVVVTSTNISNTIQAIVGVYKTKLGGSGATATFNASTLISCVSGQTPQSLGLSTNECQAQISTGFSGAVLRYVRWMDINGDGLEDLVLGSGGGHWFVYLNQGNGTLTGGIDTGSAFGLNDKTFNGSLRYADKLPTMDVDGDGKPDLVIPRASTLDGSGNVATTGFALRMCTAMKVLTVPPDYNNCPGASTVPTAGAPAQPVVTTTPTYSCVAYACPEEPGVTDTQGYAIANMPANLADDAAGYKLVQADPNTNIGEQPAAQLYTSQKFAGSPFDYSAYHLDMLKFVQTGPNNISMIDVPTALISGLNNGASVTTPSDLAGNGLASVVTTIGCPAGTVSVPTPSNSGLKYYPACSVVSGAPYGPTTLPDNRTTLSFEPTSSNGGTAYAPSSLLYANLNQGISLTTTTAQSVALQRLGVNQVAGGNCPNSLVLPGLLASVTNGLGDYAAWSYDTLAGGQLCQRDGLTEYSITGTAANLREYYFASSMPIVVAMVQSDGLGGYSGTRSAAYSYNQAMYNHYGRGFQGFESISVENLSSPINASRRLITTTEFKQEFPLTGKLLSTTTSTAPSSGLGAHTVHSETNQYQCTLLTGASESTLGDCPGGSNLFPLPNGAVTTGGTVFQPVSTMQTIVNNDLNSGSQTSHVTLSNTWDTLCGNLSAQTQTSYDDGTGGVFLSNHTKTTSNNFTCNLSSWWLDQLNGTTVQSSVTYSSAHALPAGASAPSQTLTVNYQYNTDRTPQTKTVQPQSASGDANQESTTTYTYPSTSYGLPTQLQVTGPSISLSRTTNYTYSSDGYFVATTKNGLNQTTTITTQVRDGQVISATDPNNVTVATNYDAFGRAKNITHTSPGGNVESPINVAYSSCAGGCAGVGHDANETLAAYRVITAQIGYPTKVAWYDLLGRPVKQAQAGFSGTTGTALQYAFSATLTDYDESGTVLMQSTPYYVNTDTPYFVGFTYDALGRTLTKQAQNSCPGGNMTTTYAYAGRQTNITASGTCPGGTANTAINMSRSTNVLGQLMQTVDANGKTTNYWTEPQGHVVAIQDVEGNLTTASYNPLGQRTQSTDPDQGTWNFSYNALGELVSQTDARGAVTSVTSRDALGRMLTRTEVPPATVPTGEAADKWTDIWSYDPSNGIGQVFQVTRQRGSNTPPATNQIVWQETYTYNPQSLLSSIATKVAEDATVNFTSGTSYDTYGRVATQTYPSNLVVRHSYTAYGQLDALSNDSTGYAYWVAQAQNAWGHVAQEQYPGVITGTHTDFAATGQAQVMDYAGTVADHVAYTYDSFGNLAQQVRSGQAGYTETYAYDSLQRLTQATRNGAAVNYSYSPGGNLTQKSDFAGTYTYAAANAYSTSGCGPHAVNTAGSATYSCDANGNVIGGSTITVTYDQENHARSAARTGVGNTSWAHSTNGEIAWSQSTSRGSRYYGPNGYEQIGGGAGVAQIHELGPVVVTRVAGTDQISVVLRDRLGSTIDEIDGNVPTPRSYDAFGRPLESTGTPRDTLNLANTIHGFTKHEHDDDVLLINMVGRIYDYKLGRFLQVDPVGGDGQRSNPYSYILNNPLAGTDPTGYDVECDEKGANCSLTNVKSLTVYQPHDGGKAFAVATDDKGNQIKAEAITNGSSTGVNATPLTQGTLNGIINHEASAINSMAALGFGGQSVATGSGFDKNAYDVQERNAHASEIGWGMGREMLKTGAAIGACYVRGLACVAIGLGKLSNGDASGAGWVAGGAGGAYSEFSATRAATSLQTMRGPTTVEESAAVDADVTVPASRYPESAQHIQDAQAAGQPQVLTIDRTGAAARRSAALKGTPARSGSDRDEYPPAMFQEGGRGSSVRYINPSDNRGAGACIGAQCRGLPNGARVRVTVGEDGGE